MKCENCENLLPLLIEKRIGAEEKRVVEKHLSECTRCRRSLKKYLLLERSLSALKDIPLSSEIVADSVLKKLSLDNRKDRRLSFLNIPAVASFFMLLLSLVTLLYYPRILNFSIRVADDILSSFNYFSANVSSWIAGMSDGYFWLLFFLFILLNLLITISGGIFAMRFVRE
ncbi:MAG TPA: zf-HC2 domain-containing protein [Candidatus Krumholzibacteriaceae bacterium]|nr:zf-HC2 domain-containing protein [Candidatus Krumholzibacteriaceae bacterium]